MGHFTSTRQIQQLSQLTYIFKFDAVVALLASFLGTPLECSSKEQEKSETGSGQDVQVGHMQDFCLCQHRFAFNLRGSSE